MTSPRLSAPLILAIDQGTTSTRAILFGADAAPVAMAGAEFPQIYPQPGWVEHDPEDLWRTTLETARAVLAKAGVAAGDLAGLGITNQRETVVVWDRATLQPVHNAIVWQDRRTAALCDALREAGHEAEVTARTGLRLDPYFSATKIAWILDQVPGARRRAEAGELAFGTVDSFLLARLTGGAVHATDATNASRTLLFDINRGAWDPDLLALFGVPAAMLPQVRDCACDFGMAQPEHLGGTVAIRGIAGDQHAALIGQACFQPGMVKSTYGTGCFALLNTGAQPIASTNRMLTTIAYQFDGQRCYALEGAIFVAGAAVQWLRDGLGLLVTAAEAGALAEASDPAQPVYLVPAFVGLGAPHWNSEARGTITGVTRGTTRRELARAALESVAYQTRDMLEAMHRDAAGAAMHRDAAGAAMHRDAAGAAMHRDAAGAAMHRDASRAAMPRDAAGATAEWRGETVIRVDGGMSASDWTMQFLADMLDAPVDRPATRETTALGAAFLAGHTAGVFPSPEAFAARWSLERRFLPGLPAARRAEKYAGWQDALRRALLG